MCVDVCACVICDGIPPSVSKNPRGRGGGGQEKKRSRRRRRRRRADLSTSPAHCGTRGAAAAGESEPTVPLDSRIALIPPSTPPQRKATGFFNFLFHYPPILLVSVSIAQRTVFDSFTGRNTLTYPPGERCLCCCWCCRCRGSSSGADRWIYPCAAAGAAGVLSFPVFFWGGGGGGDWMDGLI